jgi:hypothetical protein
MVETGDYSISGRCASHRQSLGPTLMALICIIFPLGSEGDDELVLSANRIAIGRKESCVK